jgi:predicted transcriptional regulator
MTTTSLKLPEDLKERATAAAQELGISPHAFMVGAIDQAATRAEQRASFIADARLARADLLKTGKGYDAHEVHAYFKARVRGKEALKPKAKPWRK